MEYFTNRRGTTITTDNETPYIYQNVGVSSVTEVSLVEVYAGIVIVCIIGLMVFIGFTL